MLNLTESNSSLLQWGVGSSCCCARAAQVPPPVLKGANGQRVHLQWEQKLKLRTGFPTDLVPCKCLLVARFSAVPLAWRLSSRNHGFALYNVPDSAHHSLFHRVCPVLVVSWCPSFPPCSSYFHLGPCTEPPWCWEVSSQEQTQASAVRSGGTA